MIDIYTDGSAKGNPGRGGYGVIMHYRGYERTLQAGYRLTTNNRMELLAVIAGLRALKQQRSQVAIYTDSAYVVNAVEKKWLQGWIKKDFKGKKNADLWRIFWKLYQQHQVQFYWIKGHDGHPENERCDRLAVAASELPHLEIDEVYEQQQKT